MNLIFIGLKNGFLRVYPYAGKQVFESLDQYWTRAAHDSEYGIVTHLAVSYDDRFFLSSGEDGNIFGYAIKNDIDAIQDQTETPKMPAYTVDFMRKDFWFINRRFCFCYEGRSRSRGYC